jgi:protoporphyrin/coproporphyrin ferrochelatase
VSDAVGVLVMAHGTPRTSDALEPFYTRIRRGRPPSPEQLSELRGRYDAIGGVSPLTERSTAQVEGLRGLLADGEGPRYVVAFGAKHVEPFIEGAVTQLLAAGVRKVVGLVLTPHGSSMGSQEYVDRAAAAISGACPFVAVPPWYAHPGLVQLLAERVTAAQQELKDNQSPESTPVIFTAHSLPERVVAAGDTYPDQLEESARLVALASGAPNWSVAWQSAGRTEEAWLGPDVRDEVRRLAAAGASDGFVVCPIGFVADHLEVLYDLDVELAAVARELGVPMARTESLNDDPRFLRVLADLVLAADRSGD